MHLSPVQVAATISRGLMKRSFVAWQRLAQERWWKNQLVMRDREVALLEGKIRGFEKRPIQARARFLAAAVHGSASSVEQCEFYIAACGGPVLMQARCNTKGFRLQTDVACHMLHSCRCCRSAACVRLCKPGLLLQLGAGTSGWRWRALGASGRSSSWARHGTHGASP
jgi:hypothetical protein